MNDFSELAPQGEFIVLLVDDSPLVHAVVQKALEGTHRVVQYYSGREALAHFCDIRPNLVLLDVEMPDMDGFEVLFALRQMPEAMGIPILFLTSKNNVEFEIQALRMGAVDYIHKPFAPEILRRRVEIHIDHALQEHLMNYYAESLQHMVEEQTVIIKELQSAIVFTLADLVEMRDDSTGGHIHRTQAYYEIILDGMRQQNVYQEELSQIHPQLLLEASQLHDIGKVAISDLILCKPGRLTPEEFEVMKTHTTIGYHAIMRAMEMTADKEFLSYAAMVALHHHEKWNGKGYPQGLVGTDIPLPARIMALVDVYDALVSERHYKKSMTHQEAMQILFEGRGTDFDPAILDVVINVNHHLARVSQSQENQTATVSS